MHERRLLPFAFELCDSTKIQVEAAERPRGRVLTSTIQMNSPLLEHAVQFYAVRAERRRRVREREAQAMQNLSQPAAREADWQKLAPVLDQAIGELAAPDRDAVVLRFFKGRPFAEIGATLRLTEDAARMRVKRALDKLHAALVRRGVRQACQTDWRGCWERLAVWRRENLPSETECREDKRSKNEYEYEPCNRGHD